MECGVENKHIYSNEFWIKIRASEGKIYICAVLTEGALAHLARARHWQCRGERFESAILHAGLRVLPAPCLYNTAKAHRRLPNEKKALNDASQRVDNGRNPLRSR